MKMENLTGKRVKISPRSITVKGDNGKTCGVVRNTEQFSGLRTSEQMKYFKIVREAGIWGESDLMNGLIFHDGKMYYLNNLKPLEFYEQYFASNPAEWESETRRYNQRKQIAENLAKHCTVIDCYVLS